MVFFMTLHRRLILAITFLLLLLLAANLVVTLHNARLNIFEQLTVHSQDTATSLGLSMSQAALNKDDVQISSMVDAIYDRGYYRRIIYRDLEGNEKIRREVPLRVDDVPVWFMSLLPLPEPSGSALVTSGWYQLGEIEVVSHLGFAYRDLWRSFKEQLWLFFVGVVLCYGLLGIGLRYVLKPLRDLEQQAEAISRREFPLQKVLPGIPEFRRVAIAMNHMVEKVRHMFYHQVELNDRLHEQLRTDQVTGLANRQDFDERMMAYCSSERSAATGVLLLAQVGNLQTINLHHGRQDGDDYLRCVAQSISGLLEDHPNHLFSRHAGADFAIFVPAILEEESRELMEKVYATLQELEWSGEQIQPVCIGAVYSSSLSDLSDIMSLADNLLSQAQNEQQSGCYWEKADSMVASLSAYDWSKVIDQAIQDQSLSFQYQPVWRVIHGQRTLLFNEMMTKISVAGVEYSAGVFVPMATRLQMMSTIDSLVIENVIEQQPELTESLCINLSIASIEDELFCRMLKKKLDDNPQLALRLIFELPANGLSFAEESIRNFATMIKSCGAKFSLHHFGRGTAEFAYLQTLPLDYLKIDRCFIQNVTTDKDAHFFIRSIVAIAKSCDVTLLAEGVETDEQWQTLIDLGIQGGQGYWLGKPSADPTIA